MKVTISKSKNQKIYYISKSIRLNGKSTTRTVEKLGTEEEVRKRADGMDPYEWAKQYAAELTRKEKESGEAIRYFMNLIRSANENEEQDDITLKAVMYPFITAMADFYLSMIKV